MTSARKAVDKKRPAAPPRRDDVLPADFLVYLQQHLAGLRDESARHQQAVAHLLWTVGHNRRTHRGRPGYVSYHHDELEQRFGRRGFVEVNTRLQVFEVTPNWSVLKKQTKGYRLTPAAAQIRSAYLAQSFESLTALVSSNGRCMHSPPKAVAAKDQDGITARVWRGVLVQNRTPVNLDGLHALRLVLDREACRQRALQRVPEPLKTANSDLLVRAEYLAGITAQTIRLAMTQVAGPGQILHRYVEARSGRLYARGLNLQTVPKMVRQAALQGFWDYDFENCHYAILQQMAARIGLDCPAIGHYLADKHGTRQRIAQRCAISIAHAKRCLVATMYGARVSESSKAAIVQTVGLDRAKQLYADPEFCSIHSNVKQARRAIVAAWPKQHATLLNDAGKSIALTESSEQRLAHLIQGVEALMLRTAVELNPSQIVLLQHDGFAATCRLDGAAIESAILQRWGYRMRLEEIRIKRSESAQLSKT